MASVAQIEANRRNAARSTGPKEAGRKRSRRNSLKHGFTGAGVCLPEGMADEVAREAAGFAEQLAPAGKVEAALVYQAALGAVRARHAAGQIEAHTVHRVRHAVRNWDEARDAEVRRWVELLATDRDEAIRQLERTAEGCDWLGDTYTALVDRANDDAGWDDADTATAAALIGLDAPTADEARVAVLDHAEGEIARLGELGDPPAAIEPDPAPEPAPPSPWALLPNPVLKRNCGK